MKENLQSLAVKRVLDYLEGDPDKNLPKLQGWADRIGKDNLFATQRLRTPIFFRMENDCRW